MAWELYKAYRDAAAGMGRLTLDSGWELCHECPAQPAGPFGWSGGGAAVCTPTLCTTTEAWPGVDVPFGLRTVIDPNWRNIALWGRNQPEPLLSRWSNMRSYTRPLPGPTNSPHYAPPAQEPFPDPYGNPVKEPLWRPAPLAPPVPMLPPAVDPLIRPPFSPEPLPVPLPWRVIPYRVPNPNRDPREQPRRGPSPRPRPRNPLDRDPLAPPVAGQPGPRVELWPTPREGMPAPGARPRPPRKRERERKVRSNIPIVLRRVVNSATEACDAVEAVYDALMTTDGNFDKKKYSRLLRYNKGKKNPACQDKARAIYDLFDQLDSAEAVRNLIANQIEDAFYGGIGQASKKGRNRAHPFSPNTGRGYQSGPWDTLMSEWANQVKL